MKIPRFMLLAGLIVLQPSVNAEENQSVNMVVYRSPSCGCCGKWLAHMQDNQFKVRDVLSDDMQAVKARLGVPAHLASCHTALVNGYVIEGHVPANDVKRLLTQKQPVDGLAVPGMPIGTPGMEMGGRQDPYQVVSFGKQSGEQVFQLYSPGN